MTFSYATESFEFEFRPVDPELHLDVLHAWLTHPNSAYWHMADITRQGLRSYMRNIAASEHEQGWMVFLHDSPVGYAEIYDPNHVLLADITEIGPGDLGIHLLTAPLEPGAPTLHGLTRALLLSATELCRSQGALRVVAGPDVSNTRIHAKNDLIGFQRIREVELPGKTALLSIKDFSVRQNLPSTEHLSRHYMEPAQRHLLAKAIAEFAHERLIHPNEVAPPADCPSAPWRPYHLPSQDCHYEFNALKLALHHWVIDESSLRRIGHNGEKLQLDTQEFIVEFHSELGIPDDLLSTYLEEIASTLASAAFKNMRGGVTASELAAPSFPVSVAADYQRTELTMTEGHPCFVASNGRIGFSLCDYMAYAPEAGNTLSYVWLAARKEHSALTLGAGVSDREHWLRELGPETLDAFNVALRDKGYEPDDFIYLPVHPWQFQHRVAVSFAPDIAAEKLVVLGETGDVHQPQQSIRTCFNRSDPHRSYVKTALSIQNMGFLRGQSAEFMKDAPAISDFVADIVRSDPFLSELGFDVLREHASVGYTGDAYHYPHMPDVRSAHRKMISVLWLSLIHI